MVTSVTRMAQLRGVWTLHGPSVPSMYTSIRGIVSSKLFVGGLSFNTQEDSLRQAFAPHGEVEDVKIITDRETGRSRGFGFVTFGTEADAEAALSGMDGKVIDGRAIRVDYASSVGAPRAGGGFGRGRVFGGGGGGNSFGGGSGNGASGGFGIGSSGYGDGDGSYGGGYGDGDTGGGGFGRSSG